MGEKLVGRESELVGLRHEWVGLGLRRIGRCCDAWLTRIKGPLRLKETVSNRRLSKRLWLHVGHGRESWHHWSRRWCKSRLWRLCGTWHGRVDLWRWCGSRSWISGWGWVLW